VAPLTTTAAVYSAAGVAGSHPLYPTTKRTVPGKKWAVHKKHITVRIKLHAF
jgi:hypothetical protein